MSISIMPHTLTTTAINSTMQFVFQINDGTNNFSMNKYQQLKEPVYICDSRSTTATIQQAVHQDQLQQPMTSSNL